MSKRLALFSVSLMLVAVAFCSTGCRAGNPYGMQQQPYNQPVMQQGSFEGYGYQQQSIGQNLPQFGRQVGRRFVDLILNRGMNHVLNGIF